MTATLILVNGPPGVGKSTIARRLRDDRPLSLLVDFDDLWLLIGGWHDGGERAQRLAIDDGLAMARAHLAAGHDVVAAQLAVDPEFFEVLGALAEDTGAILREVVLTGEPAAVAARFRRRRQARTTAGEPDVSDNVADDRVDEVIARATEALAALAEARPQTLVVATADHGGGEEATYRRVLAALG